MVVFIFSLFFLSLQDKFRPAKSWGVMLFEMIVGMTPFYDGTQDQVCGINNLLDMEFFLCVILIESQKHLTSLFSIATRKDGSFQEHRKM